MNREIKFRSFVKYTKEIFEAGKIDIQHKRVYERNHPSSYYLLDDIELMQFTGLHDKNGKEIYESDVVYVTSEDENAFILWDKESARYIIQFTGWCADFDNFYGKELEVIGNLYENSELLGGE